jgi:hypothetical protein
MARAPSCLCGSCAVCRGRAAAARSRARKAAAREANPEPIHQAIHPVDPKAVAYMRELREIAGPGAVVGIRGSTVMIDRVGHDRLVFASIDAALEWACAS